MGFRIGSWVALAALMGIGSTAMAQSVPDEEQGTQGREQGERGGRARPQAEQVKYGGGMYDNGQLQDDWFYDTYTTEKGFGSDFFQRSNLMGSYEGKQDENDWFFDSYQMMETQERPGMGTPRPGAERGNEGQGEQGQGGQAQGGQKQGGEKQGGEKQGGEKQGGEKQGGRAENISLDGKVVGIKEVEVSGEQVGAGAMHQVVLLSDADNRYVVDLGPAEALSEINLQLGDNVSVEGKLGRVGPRAVLFADQLMAQGQEPLNIQQDLELETEALPRQPARAQDITGDIIGIKEVMLENGNSHTVALVNTENEGAMPIDLGASQQFAGFGIGEGDTITVTAHLVPVGEYLVGWADQLDLKGEKIDLRKEQQRQGGGRARGTR